MEDDGQSVRYNEEPNIDRLDGLEGIAETENVFALDLSDDEITNQLNEKINNSRDFWNNSDGFNLKSRRKRNARFLVGDHWHNVPLFQYHVPYVQNEIWTAEHVTSALVTGKLPELEVYPAQDTPESRGLAQDLAAMMRWHSEEYDLQEIMCNIALSVLNNYIGLIQLEWDPSIGESGDIRPRYVDPADVIIDKRAKLGRNPRFICITKQADSDELMAQFPDKAKAIKDRLGDKQSAVITYREVWCTYYLDNKPEEGVVWYFENTVLGKAKNPNWIYDEKTEGTKNALPYPTKPFIPFNFINDGSHWIDRAGPIDQAIPLQLMLNRIGKQIQEGVAHASPVLIFNKRALSKSNADNITGQPWEKILVDAEDVRTTFGVIQANQVPQFVVQEIERLKGVIHEVFGTPPQLRGESEYRQTLGQDLMAREQAEGRQELLVRAIDRGMDRYYKYLFQMMKVYYTDKHYISVLGEDGRYDFISLNRDSLEDGMKVTVKAGTTLPQNKARMQEMALELAKMNRISNLSLYEFMDIPNPGKHVERLIKEQVDAVSTIEEIKDDNQDRNAVQDYEAIKVGEPAPPRDDVDMRHILTHQKQLLSNDFIENWNDEKKMELKDHIQIELDKLKQLSGITDQELYAPQAPQGAPGQPPAPENAPSAPAPIPQVPVPPAAPMV